MMPFSFPAFKRKMLLGTIAAAALTAPLATSVQAADFKFAGPLDAYTLDPHAVSNTLIFAVLANVYEPLVRRNAEQKIEPALATEWKQTDDTTWEFTLRQGVKFSNGNPFTADDVVFSLTRGQAGGIKANLNSIASIEKVDDYKIRIRTRAVNPILPNQITNWYIMDKEWAEANGAVQPGAANNATETFANRNAMGTGPYVIKERDPGVKTVFATNSGWWDKKAGNIDNATFFVIPNPSTRVSALISGEVDLIDGVPPQDAERIDKADGLHVKAGPDLRTIYVQPDVARDSLIFGSEKAKNPFKELKVRQAMELAIDTGAIQKRIMRNYSVPVGLPIGKEINGFDPELGAPVKPDVDKAKELMKEAGYENGFSVTLDCTNDRFMNDEATCLAVAASLARINIKVEPRAQATSRWATQVNPPEYNTSLAMLGYSPATYDAHIFLTSIAATRDPKSGLGAFNIGGYSNPEVDKLIAAIGKETDQGKRTDLIQQAFKLIKADVGFIPLHQLNILWGVKDNVTVVQPADLAYPLRYFAVK
ncbi:ABC transporter substrate-binding protein [Neorhizobium petrolearium]|uniref:ABC transporter substrate-binding protein n=2 Tax=Neorhizobium petrolearium TaxID=515361 RepID=A0ABY8LZH3_9HYPH|nr:ABC transporter substrate-binding protein [Neorhizobium petrolearium]WGI67723.1 ABC transporter substrate-binding protein [Neorhizobium petrolearium]